METVIVTGSSSGIGLSIAHLLQENGYRVFGTSRNPDQHQASSKIELLPLDVTDPTSIQQCCSRVIGKTGSIDVLINNAGSIVFGSAEETSLALAKRQFEVNFWGAVNMTKEVLPFMRKQKRGKLITIGSLAGLIGVPFECYYAASKHAIEGFYKSLRLELRPMDIQVSVIEPGFFKSNLYKTASFAEPSITDYDGVREAVLKEIEHSVNTAAEPQEVSRTVLKVVQSKHPKFSYRIGMQARVLPVLHFLSPRMYEQGAAKKFKVR